MISLALVYLAAYLSVLLHEGMHMWMCRIYHIQLVHVQIGTDWLQIHVGKFSISPVIGLSFVETKYDEIDQLSTKQKTIYFLSGCIGNVFLALLFGCFWLYWRKYTCLIMAIMNLSMAMVSVLPIGHTDMRELISFVRKH